MKKKNKPFKSLGSLALLFFVLFHLGFQFNLSTYLPVDFTGKTDFIQRVHAEEEPDKSNYTNNFLPNPEYLQQQWNLNLMNIGEAWADGYTGLGIKIAILDTGFYHRHPDISMAGGYSVFSDDPWSNDHSGHGTHIAGIISAKKNTTYQGIAPDAEVYGIKIYHSEDINESGDVATDVDSVIRGIRQAIVMEADIIVISSGLNYHDENLYEIIKEAYDKEIMIIAASGNGNLTVNYPANYNEVIAITAVDEELNPALDIIYGQENEFSAPGVNIGGLSIPDSSYSYPYIFMSGSSQATPHAAGLAAIFMQKYQVRGEAIRKVMREQAVSIGEPGLFGYGLLYYQGNNSPMNDLSDKEIDPIKEINRDKSMNDTPEDNDVRKPFSSREADKELEEDELLNYRRAVITLDNEGIGRLSGNIFSLIEVGGTLELTMDKITSLRLTKEQIYEIRQNNLTLILAKEGISWKIPASNFVPGQAILRFYEGEPLGTNDNPSSYSNIYTISIFQTATRQGLYPGEMQVRFDLNSLEVTSLENLEPAYFNKERLEWLPLEKEVDDEKITVKTRYTGAIGFFDPQEVVEKVVLESEVDTTAPVPLHLVVISISSLILILTTVRFFFKRRKQ